MTLQQIADFLKASPKAWVDLTAAQKQEAEATLLPKIAGFDGAQRAWFKDWWLACTAAQVASINSKLPAGTRVEPVTIAGKLYLSIDLVTDVIKPTDTYYPARSVIRLLVCTFTQYTPPA